MWAGPDAARHNPVRGMMAKLGSNAIVVLNLIDMQQQKTTRGQANVANDEALFSIN